MSAIYNKTYAARTEHLQIVAREWLDHYHADRPHQGKKNELLTGPKRKGRPPKRRASSGAFRVDLCTSTVGPKRSTCRLTLGCTGPSNKGCFSW